MGNKIIEEEETLGDKKRTRTREKPKELEATKMESVSLVNK